MNSYRINGPTFKKKMNLLPVCGGLWLSCADRTEGAVKSAADLQKKKKQQKKQKKKKQLVPRESQHVSARRKDKQTQN